MKKNRLCRVDGLDYIDHINNNQVLTWARNDRIRAYIDSEPEHRDDNLRKQMRYFIEAINEWPIMAEKNLGLFKDDEEVLYNDFMDMINEERDLGSLGILGQDKGAHGQGWYGCDCGWEGTGTGPNGKLLDSDRCPECGEYL